MTVNTLFVQTGTDIIARRPIPAGALLTALFCVIASLLGYPMDLAVWQPVMSVALVVGVFVPLLEAGMEMTRKGKTTQSAAIVVFSSALVNPVFGWSLTMLLDNLGSIGNKQRSRDLGVSGRALIPAIGFVIMCIAWGRSVCSLVFLRFYRSFGGITQLLSI